MKLNLLPTYASKSGQSQGFVILSVLMVLGSAAAAAFMIFASKSALDKAREEAVMAQPGYVNAVATSNKADEVIQVGTDIDKNIKLAKAMKDHNAVYPDLYDEVLQYVPPFFRVTSITATANGANSCTVVMSGVLKSFQQYADTNLALLRIPNATSVVRSGYTIVDKYVPAVNETDTAGAMIKPGENNIPSKPLDRMNDMIARASSEPTGYLGVGGFGDPSVNDKGAMPGSSAVTFTVSIAGRNLQTPNPKATVLGGGGGGGGGAPQGGPSTPGGGGSQGGLPTPPLPQKRGS